MCFTDVFFFFFRPSQNMRQPFSERIFMKLLPNDSGENGVSNVIPKWGLGPRLMFLGLKTTQCALLHVGAAAWRLTQNNCNICVCLMFVVC